MNPSKSVYEVAAAISSSVTVGSISRNVSGSTDPSRCRCSSANGPILAIIAGDGRIKMEAADQAIVAGRHRDAFGVLGPHGNEIRAWLPHAEDAWVVTSTGSIEMERAHPSGFFIGKLKSPTEHLPASIRHLRIRRSLPLPSPVDSVRAVSSRRGHQSRKLSHAGRANGGMRRRRGRAVRGVGAECRRGQRASAISIAGIAPGIPCGCARQASGRFSYRAWARARIINIRCWHDPARSSRNATHTDFTPKFRPRPRPSSGACQITRGTMPRGWKRAPTGTGCMSRFRFTKCIWKAGCAVPKTAC